MLTTAPKLNFSFTKPTHMDSHEAKSQRERILVDIIIPHALKVVAVQFVVIVQVFIILVDQGNSEADFCAGLEARPVDVAEGDVCDLGHFVTGIKRFKYE